MELVAGEINRLGSRLVCLPEPVCRNNMEIVSQIVQIALELNFARDICINQQTQKSVFCVLLVVPYLPSDLVSLYIGSKKPRFLVPTSLHIQASTNIWLIWLITNAPLGLKSPDFSSLPTHTQAFKKVWLITSVPIHILKNDLLFTVWLIFP